MVGRTGHVESDMREGGFALSLFLTVRNLLILKRRDVRVVEGARLESVCRGNSTEGSNPSLSANSQFGSLVRNLSRWRERRCEFDSVPEIRNFRIILRAHIFFASSLLR